MILLLRQAWKELRHDRRFALLFLFNLALGLSGLVTMAAFRSSLQDSLQENAAALLSADLAVSVRRPFTANESAAIANLASTAEARSRMVETFSMVRGPSGSRLVMLRGLGEGYPLRGQLRLGAGTVVKNAAAELAGAKAWMEPELARQLGLAPGNSFSLAAKKFTLVDLIAEDPTQSFRGLTLAGRIHLALPDLEATGLLRTESTASYLELLRFPAGTDIAATAERGAAAFTDPAVRVRSADDSADDSGRLLSYLADFLGLAALVALFLSSLGAAYLFRTWLVRRAKAFALHQVLGLPFGQATAIPLMQILLLAIAAVPVAALLAFGELALLSGLVDSLSPVPLRPALSLSALLLAFAVASAGAFLLALPLLFSLRALAPRDLLGGHLPEPRLHWRDALLYLPAGALLYALSIAEANSYRNASLFMGALAGSSLALLLAGFLCLRLLSLGTKARGAPWPLRHALLYLSRRGLSALSAFMALALGALLLNLLPQLRASLGAEITAPDRGALPSLFLFDIQEEQLTPLTELLAAKGFSLQNVSPLVRARLLQVNGQDFERAADAQGFRTREEENEARFRNRGFNLSYRESLSEAETLVTGRPFGDGPEISLEERFAERLSLKLGDEMRFDVQGVEITGKVVNLRRVRWTSFQPNFFVLFSPGNLEGAPKIFLGSLPALGPEKKEEVQNLLAERFANVSVVDVKSTVDRALALADRMRGALNLMSAIALFAGLVVLFSIAYRQAELRRWDMNLCQVLGASSSHLRAQMLWEFGLLAISASALGGLLSVAFSWLTARFLFDGTFRAAPGPLALVVLASTFLALAVAWVGTQGLWRRNPAELLQD